MLIALTLVDLAPFTGAIAATVAVFVTIAKFRQESQGPQATVALSQNIMGQFKDLNSELKTTLVEARVARDEAISERNELLRKLAESHDNERVLRDKIMALESVIANLKVEIENLIASGAE